MWTFIVWAVLQVGTPAWHVNHEGRFKELGTLGPYPTREVCEAARHGVFEVQEDRDSQFVAVCSQSYYVREEGA